MKGPEGCINGPADTGTLSELRRGMKDDPGNSVLACTGGPGNYDLQEPRQHEGSGYLIAP